MSLASSGRIWDDASSPDIAGLARQYEADWRNAREVRPEPRDYLPPDSSLRAAALLGLLRIDLALRWGASDRIGVEWYRDRYPELGEDALVALLYEEYCLREESGETPGSAEYVERFPDLAASFREVLEIHGLIGPERPFEASRPPPHAPPPLPESGESIAGFRLAEELGRGAFGRVFRAEERDLADRPVALKVTRTGSREPQALARLQHTHIVPVYSYRTEPGMGLHLLCMPYLGRVTLGAVLTDPAIREARSGSDLVAVIERLQDGSGDAPEHPAVPPDLARLSYARAIAWWGARLAEALQHAHDRGILHRDVKPSNILLTGDGLPMLLDFNLAVEAWLEGAEISSSSALGGTLAYLAPEHLEAIADGRLDRVDARCDIYALGVVLFDCLVRGTRTFALPTGPLPMIVAMRRAAESRRAEVPRLRATHADVPRAFESVVRRCLAPNPRDRYDSAADLAADLQALADDAPLRFAREPLFSRGLRGLRRHRRGLAFAAPLVGALGVAVVARVGAQLTELRVKGEVDHWITEGKHALAEDHPELAVSHFAAAGRLARNVQALHEQLDESRALGLRAENTRRVRDLADELSRLGERLRFNLLGFGGEPQVARGEVREALARFAIPEDRDWSHGRSIADLDPPRRARLLNEVNELLFFWIVSLARDRPGEPSTAREVVRICAVAEAFAEPAAPWREIREHYTAQLAGQPSPERRPGLAASEDSARACFQRGLLSNLEGRDREAIDWLERATRLEPSDYWSHFFLGLFHDSDGRPVARERALEHYSAAVALRERTPWIWNNLGLLHYKRGDLEQSLVDWERALALADEFRFPFWEARLNLGLAKRDLGDVAGARAAFESVVGSGVRPWSVAARLDLANLDVEAGAVDRAWTEYDALLADQPRDSRARLSRAILAQWLGRLERAEDDLTTLLRDDPEEAAEVLARRASVRLALGHSADAETDAAGAFRRKPTPTHQRLWTRTLLAQGRVADLLWLDDPGDLALLPRPGPALRADLRASVDRLGAEGVSRPHPPLLHRVRAVLLGALGDPSAEAEAGRAIALAPQSPENYLVRARVRHLEGRRRDALADVEAGLALERHEPRLLELRGILETGAGHPGAALVDLDRALLRGAQVTIRVPRAQALMALRRFEEAVKDWSLALEGDAEDPRLYLGRARARVGLKRYSQALIDLEQASAWAGDDPALLSRIALTYAACLPGRPERFPRALAHVRRACLAWAGAAPRMGR